MGNGVATVTVSRLSPFAIVSTGVAVPDTIVTDPPKTGHGKPARFCDAGPCGALLRLSGSEEAQSINRYEKRARVLKPSSF